MISSKKLNSALMVKTQAEDCETEYVGGSGVKRYNYNLEFSEYRTLPLLRKQVKRVTQECGVKLVIDGIEPILRTTDSKIESRIQVTVKETENRFKKENVQLSEFEEK